MKACFTYILKVFYYAYKVTLSPWLGLGCRFEPTCSRYAYEAISLHGFAAGSRLSLRRLCSCHPWGKCGYDPVPHLLSRASSKSRHQQGFEH